MKKKNLKQGTGTLISDDLHNTVLDAFVLLVRSLQHDKSFDVRNQL